MASCCTGRGICLLLIAFQLSGVIVSQYSRSSMFTVKGERINNILEESTRNSKRYLPNSVRVDGYWQETVDPYSGCITSSDEAEDVGDACPFLFKEAEVAFQTAGGEFRVVTLGEENLLQRRQVAIGLLTLEPNTLLLPQYFNGPCLFYVHRGEAYLWDLKRKDESSVLSSGELRLVSAGTPFHILNALSNEKLQMLLLIELSDMPAENVSLQCFYLAGGLYPATVMSGFSEELLAAAYKERGPIVNATGLSANFLASMRDELTDDEEITPFNRKLSANILASMTDELRGDQSFNKKKKKHHHRLFGKKQIFRNENGWSASIDHKRYEALKDVNVGMFAVGLKSGSLVAPNWNQRMVEIGVVTHGEGSLVVVASDGTTLVDAQLQPGSIFVVPRYYPSTKSAGNESDFEYVGFTTSSAPIEPFFIAGTNGIFKKMDWGVLTTAFDVEEASVEHALQSQPDMVILAAKGNEW
ncbi:hypothetical protein KP509_36G056200 [Ceratopteris richardii]|uniref:Cupin type-1 domain-containing protein n=1 Tax=Ceratopteris richardii TaxID=49495 RepID=A0A8T2QD72_CERRI|nr:hypothetical protein KP509_36G056200 [Ceratopteris richardii]